MASSVKVLNSCTSQPIMIPVADFDGDDVRCRFASSSAECSGICTVPSYFTLYEPTCTLTYSGSASDGNYAIAIQIEDFINPASTLPLSSVPLQFIVNVNSTGSCSNQPTFISPTPAEGSTMQVYNGSLELKARVRPSNVSEWITKFHILSPLNLVMSAISQPVSNEYEVTISWTATHPVDKIGEYISCFSAETNNRLSSGSRCITVNYTGHGVSLIGHGGYQRGYGGNLIVYGGSLIGYGGNLIGCGCSLIGYGGNRRGMVVT
ncbi:uncharacterized protein LOC133196787 [Saccostrea echinata]|uniref:uncharacterized protein LOC133196787 n=1 Tax=Saccostrea echinata TaxID=191078 RepID=UPI002A7FE55A|nr:uncharacterized protein LOC133196787 [Saccostrea echinata]